MINLFEIKKLEEIEDKYDVFLIDLWGVIHNGIELFQHVKLTLNRLKEKKKMIIFVTNAPRRSYVIEEQLQNFGLNKSYYDFVSSSGEITWLNVREKFMNKNCYLIGPPRDYHLIDGLNLNLIDNHLSSDVDIIINTGPWGDSDRIENYTEILKNLVRFNPIMICSNPDKIVIRGKNFMICAGLLAEFYEKIGGRVEYYGKPYNQIYQFCYKKIKKKNPKILIIGDSLDNDIKGANLQKIDSLLITDGIHREVNKNNKIDKDKLDDLIKKKNVIPNFYMKQLN
ncbi:MAG: TIGR01459 family HAD-type hydrolase [Alphaproteobacteria bacterium]